MEWHLRLAEKRGLLTGRSLSPPAVLATELLYLIEMKDKAKEFWNQFRISLVAGEDDPDRIRKLFPELFIGAPEEVEEEKDIDEIDLSKIAWSAPQTNAEYEEFMKLRAALESSSNGVITDTEGFVGYGDWQ